MGHTTHTIRSKVAASSAVTRFRGAPHDLVAMLSPDIAERVTVEATARGWDTLYRYRLHMDRTAAHSFLNKRSDNNARMLVRDVPCSTLCHPSESCSVTADGVCDAGARA